MVQYFLPVRTGHLSGMISAKKLDSVAIAVHKPKLAVGDEKLEKSSLRNAVVYGIRLFMLYFIVANSCLPARMTSL